MAEMDDQEMRDASPDPHGAMSVEDNTRLLDPSQQKILAHSSTFVGMVESARESVLAAAGVEPAAMDDDRDLHVCIRTRPLLDIETERLPGAFDVVTVGPSSKVFVHQPSFSVRGAPRVQSHDFRADFAFGQGDSTQVVYDQAVRSLVSLAAGGGVGTVFCYGQTGSGKTHTMSGIEEFVAQDIFADIAAASGGVSVSVSFFELLGHAASDLLSSPPGKPLDIKENVLGEVIVNGLTEVDAPDADTLLAVVRSAAALRRTEATYRNDVSSRSHGLCMIRTKNMAIPEAEDGRLFLVDLAGSERRADKLRHDAQRAEESRLNNASLLALKECMRQRAKIASGGEGVVHIPYRSSRLTLLLKDAFEVLSFRPTRTLVIACLSPHFLDASHTLNTCRYAAPIRLTPRGTEVMRRDPDDPVGWTHDQLSAFVAWASANRQPIRVPGIMASDDGEEPVMERVELWLKRRERTDAEAKIVSHTILCPTESGAQLARLPEAEFVRRCTACDGVTLKAAKEFYVRFWELVVDARTRRRGGLKGTHARDRMREVARVGASDCEETDVIGVFIGTGYVDTKITRMRRERGKAKREKHGKK